MKLIEVEGVGPTYAEKLAAAGLQTTEDLLERGATVKGRDEIEKATGIRHDLVLKWVNHVDLMRLQGVGSEYSDLLEAAGVDSPLELSHRVAANLAAKLAEVNLEKKLVRRVPSETVVADWIKEAAALPKVIEH